MPFSPQYPQQRVEELSLLEETLEGIQEILKGIASPYGGKELPVVHSPGNYYLRELFKQRKEISFPFLATTLQNVVVTKDGYNQQTLRTRGIIMETADNENTLKILHAKEVMGTLQVFYFSQIYEESLKFTERWLYRQPNSQFTLGNDNIDIYIHVNLNDELTIPTEVFDDIGNLYQYETSLTFRSFIGEVETRQRLNSVSISFENTNSDNSEGGLLDTVVYPLRKTLGN